MADDWLIVKRDLYFRPDRQGYTGIRDLAGRYSYEEAKGYADHGCSMVKLSDAPEFSKACYPGLAAAHMQKQRDILVEALKHAKARFECLAEDFSGDENNVNWAMCSVDSELMTRALDAVGTASKP